MSINERLASEVTSLSTKLVTAVAKSSELEENVLTLHRELASSRAAVARMSQYQDWYRTMLPKYSRLQDELRATREAKRVAETQNAKLQGEVEDLTASLFNEANEMVSNASRETFNFKVKNRKLYEEIEEKQTIIDDLQEQLRHLKEMFAQMDDQQRASNATTPHLESAGTFSVPPQMSPLGVPVFSPLVHAVRLDLNNYNQDFKAFIYAICKPDFTFELSALRGLRYFKKIWTEELEPAVTVPALPNSTLINRWSKSKSFWSCVVEGRAMIEPVKGVNEVFKSTTKIEGVTPVAIKDPCSFCGDSREDTLEHSRLYTFKLLAVQAQHTHTDEDLIASFPLCNYCLIKMRHICDLFAKLRSVHANVYKLRPDTQFDEYAFVPTSIAGFKRNSASFTSKDTASLASSEELMNTSVSAIPLDNMEEAKMIKIYITLALTRAKIFWSKFGFWDTDRDTAEVSLDDLHIEVFSGMVRKKDGEKREMKEMLEHEVANKEELENTLNEWRERERDERDERDARDVSEANIEQK